MKHALLVAVALVGCGKSSKQSDSMAGAVACDAKTIAELETNLDKANGYNVDLTDAKVKADIETAKKAIMGKKLAFTSATTSAVVRPPHESASIAISAHENHRYPRVARVGL